MKNWANGKYDYTVKWNGLNPSSYFSQRLQTAEPEAEKTKMESLFKQNTLIVILFSGAFCS